MPDSTADTLAIVGLAGGLVLGISAAVGEHTYKECDRAVETWRLGAAIGGGSDERARREARDFEKRHRSELAAAEKSAATDQPVEVPRGFFCTTSATHVDAGFCVREKADCQRSRDAAVIAIADMAECSLQEKAWCTGERCAPSAAVCEARREHMGSDAPACIENE